MAFTAKSSHLVDDMVLLSKVNEDAIVDNLKKRIMEDLMFTYIGPVLIAVNPFKLLPYFDDATVEHYQGVPQRENPPHVYGLTDNAYRDMLIDQENHCVIISGESGAGKTVTAKYLMGYIAKVSGGGDAARHVKDCILDSNPLLEAFGNAKTVRNNNSSRFGKYFEIQFSLGGIPDGGRISNFLLEKSRVVSQNKNERNFHIFYQMISGCSAQQKEAFGLQDCNYFTYLNTTGCTSVDGMDDSKEFQDTLNSMTTMGISDSDRESILQVSAALLHLGNISFLEDNSSVAYPENDDFLQFPAYLLGVEDQFLKEKIVSREMTGVGRRGSVYQVNLNQEQAQYTRDTLVKTIYTRLFDYLVLCINRAMQKDYDELSIGVLDIYGFEIFERNGFEQFCINFVNEKLQQIFIELTLKAEQEEYDKEGIAWKKIDYFNNKIVCDLIEEKRPPGIMAIMDDVCATMHAQGDGADEKFLEKADGAVGTNKHFAKGPGCFTIKHYAGDVKYNINGFCERNRDMLYKDLIKLMQSSNIPFLVSLFPDDTNADDRKRPVTYGATIKSQANLLVSKLMKCQPHYIRCIKPNETKKPKDWDNERCSHQVKYLGLQENIRVRRAGFAYRNEFAKFLKRFAICSEQTWPAWRGDPKQGCTALLNSVNMDPQEWQLGVTKIFIKSPESLFMLEELRERNYSVYARVIQRMWRKYYSVKEFIDLKQRSTELWNSRKERHKGSINRKFVGDCLGVRDTPAISQFVGKREQIAFGCVCEKYDHKFKAFQRKLVLTGKNIYLIGREKAKDGPKKGQVVPVCTDTIGFEKIESVTVSTLQDGFVILKVAGEFGIVLSMPLKTEFVTVLDTRMKKAGRTLSFSIADSITYPCKKSLLDRSGHRTITFVKGSNPGGAIEIMKKGKVHVEAGLPASTTPSRVQSAPTRSADGPPGGRPGPPGGRPGPPVGGGGRGPPMGGGAPRPSMGGGAPRPPMGGGAPRPPMGGGAPRPPMGGGAPRPPMGGGAPRPSMGGGAPRPRMGGGAPRPAGGGAPRARPPGGLAVGGAPPRPRSMSGPPGSRPPTGRGGAPRPRSYGGPPGGGRPPRPMGAGGRPTRPTGARPRGPRPTGASTRPPGSRPPMGAGAPRARAPAPRPARPAAPAKKQCRSLYDYTAGDTDELTFNEGDIITITDQSTEGWWTGELNGNSGMFPANYVEMI